MREQLHQEALPSLAKQPPHDGHQSGYAALVQGGQCYDHHQCNLHSNELDERGAVEINWLGAANTGNGHLPAAVARADGHRHSPLGEASMSEDMADTM